MGNLNTELTDHQASLPAIMLLLLPFKTSGPSGQNIYVSLKGCAYRVDIGRQQRVAHSVHGVASLLGL